MKILLVCSTFPYPANSGGRIRDFNLIRSLSRNHSVHLVSFVKSTDELKFVIEMEKYCTQVDTVLLEKRSKLRHLPSICRTLLSWQPLDNAFFHRTKMVEKIRAALEGKDIDIYHIEHLGMASYIRAVPAGYGIKKVLCFYDIDSLRFRRMMKTETSLSMRARCFLNWLPATSWERKISRIFDLCITTSEKDKEILLSRNGGANIAVVPNGVDTQSYRIMPFPPDSSAVCFVGAFDYGPNVDAVLYFSREIFPLIKKRVPNLRFIIVGRCPPEEIRLLARNGGITVTGSVEDVRPFYKESAVSVVPLRSGGGTRLKILEAMALGRPVISSSMGCEGLNVRHGENILIADEPGEFAELTASLLMDVRLREIIAENARRLVENEYDWVRINSNLACVYSKLIDG